MNTKLPQWVSLCMLGASFVALITGCDNGSHSTQQPRQVSAGQVQGSSFDDVTTAPPAPSEIASVTSSSVEGITGGTPEGDAALTSAAVAVGMPADISKIPSATPVAPTPTVVASAAGGNPAPQPVAQVDAGEFQAVSFQTLSGFKYVEPIPKEGAKPEETEAQRKKNQIPPAVQALNGKKAVVEGYMVPMEVDDDGGVKSFVLVKTQPQCCFGDTQAMNEWVDVKMDGGNKAEFNVDRPIKVYGDLEVGEKMEDGFVLSIYRMNARKAGS